MKAKFIFEKFTEDSDPITDMGIGIRYQISQWMKEIRQEDTDDNALIQAAKYGKLNFVKFLVQTGADIHFKNDQALQLAIEDGHLEVAKYLVQNGADIHAGGDYPLRRASYNGHLEFIKFLVQNGANIHTDENGLYGASKNGHLEVVKYLVQNGADIHEAGDYALRQASKNGHLEVIKYLVQNGADIHEDNDQALQLASKNGHLEVVKYLVQNGADVMSLNSNDLRNIRKKGYIEILNYIKNERIRIKSKKVLKESLFEKFTEDSDPIKDMGIGAPAIIKDWKTKIKNEDRRRAKKNKLMWYFSPLKKWRDSIGVIANVFYIDSLDIHIEAGQYKDKNGPINFSEYIHSILESLHLTQFLKNQTPPTLAGTWISYEIKPQYLQLFKEAAFGKDIKI